jgi:hypothetical protein
VAQVSALTVSSDAEIDQVVSQYVIQGFMIVNRTAGHATLLKKKELNGTTLVLCLVLGLVVCEIPLIIYLIVYLTQSDRMVQINVANTAAEGQYSPDGRWRWVNGAWVPAARDAGSPEGLPGKSLITPAAAEGQYSPDGRWRLVNGAWVPSSVPATRDAGSPEGLPGESFITPADDESQSQESRPIGPQQGTSVGDSLTETPPRQDDTIPMPDLIQEVAKKKSKGGGEAPRD